MPAGIYKITNVITHQFYFGSSVNVATRMRSHKSRLSKGVHDNIFLQRSYDKYGKNAFTFEAIETVEPIKSLILEREQYYLDLYFDHGKQCFNLCPIAESSLGRVLSEEARQKLKKNAPRGESHWAFGKKQSESTRQKISNVLTGKRPSTDTKRRVS